MRTLPHPRQTMTLSGVGGSWPRERSLAIAAANCFGDAVTQSADPHFWHSCSGRSMVSLRISSIFEALPVLAHKLSALAERQANAVIGARCSRDSLRQLQRLPAACDGVIHCALQPPPDGVPVRLWEALQPYACCCRECSGRWDMFLPFSYIPLRDGVS